MTRTDPLVEAVLDAARVLVAISVRSLAATGEVITVSQLRVLMLVSGGSEVNVADVATELGVHRSNATRVVDRLVRAGLLARSQHPGDRRRLVLALTGDGRRLVADVDAHRRTSIAEVLDRIPASRLDGAEAVWRAFADAG